MNSDDLNIKARFQVFIDNSENPESTIYEHEIVKELMSESNFKLKINDIVISDGTKLQVTNIKLEVLNDEVPNHLVGYEIARLGNRLSYNFEVQVYLTKI